MTQESILLNVLQDLRPVGYEGFEGLILKLLERLAGDRFYLAKAGYQAGQDMSNIGLTGNYISAECKRYNNKTSLNEREILGELVQAHQANPDLDLWILAATSSIKKEGKLIQKLLIEGRSKGIEILPIESTDGNPSSIEALCAYGGEIVIDFVQAYYSNLNELVLKKLKGQLIEIKKKAGYEDKISFLKKALSENAIGYDNWRKEQNNWLLAQFGSEENSKCSFRQVIKVHGKGNTFIKRKSALEQLENWLNRWRENKIPFVLTGDQGDGKTWAVASWLTEYIKSKNETPVIFLPSGSVAYTDVELLLSHAIKMQLKVHEAVFWTKKIRNWMKRSDTKTPTIILVIDGINENFSFDWRAVFDQLKVEPWCNRIALVMTSRTVYWRERFSDLRDLNVRHWTLPPYNDEELDKALKRYNKTISELPIEFNFLMRKPRYLDLVVKHNEKIMESGDITIPRLIYEDFKDRIERKRYKTLTNEKFEGLICSLAEKIGTRENLIEFKDFSELFSIIEEKQEVFEELKTSGIFIQDNLRLDKYKVESKRLAYGLGIILLDSINQISSLTLEAVDECIASFLEPQSEIDFKVEIVAAAVFHSMAKRGFPDIVRLGLLKYWINLVNIHPRGLEDFNAYFPCSPGTYFALAEHVWEKQDNPYVESLFKYTFARWAKESRFLELFKSKFEKWMGYVSIYGFLRLIDEDVKAIAEKNRKEVQKRLGFELKLGPVLFMDFPLTLIDKPIFFRFFDLALCVISHLNRKPFIRAITLFVLAETVMGDYFGNDSIKWILRTSKGDIWPELEQEVFNLIEKNNKVAYKTAHRLLSYEGSEKALQLRSKLPKDLFEKDSLLEEYKKDPCKSVFQWERKQYYKCLQRSDISLFEKTINMKIFVLEPGLHVPKNYVKELSNIKEEINPPSIWAGGLGRNIKDSIFEDYSTPLYAFSPNTIAEITKSIFRDAVNRDIENIFRLSVKSSDHYLIFGNKEIAAIKKVWKKLQKDGGFKKENNLVEMYLFRIALAGFSAMEQLLLLIPREEKENFYNFELFFKKLDSHSWDDVLNLIQKTNDNDLWKILWFISKYPKDIPKIVLDKVKNFFGHSFLPTRLYAMMVTYSSEDPDLIDFFINSSWSYNSKNFIGNWKENYWGSLLIAKFGIQLSYDEICYRIIPSLLPYAISQRGNKNGEIKKYAENLSSVLERIKKDKKYTKMQKKLFESTREWLGSTFESHLLKEVIEIKPDFVQKWIEPILSKSYPSDCNLKNYWSFYNKLCGVLFDIDPEEGVRLYRRMTDMKRSVSIYQSLSIDLFGAQKGAETIKLWNEIIDDCYTDISALEIAVENQRADNADWFQHRIEQYLASYSLFEKSRGINMLGFLDKKYARDKLSVLLDEIPECWVRPVIETAIKRWERNQWAKTWFQRFMENKDKIKAWAAFKLFLKCVDRRFWIWKNQIMEKFQDTPFFEKRKIFFDLNREDIRRSIEGNEKKLNDTFLGLEIKKDIWPWS